MIWEPYNFLTISLEGYLLVLDNDVENKKNIKILKEGMISLGIKGKFVLLMTRERTLNVSTNFIICTELKKCKPTHCCRRPEARCHVGDREKRGVGIKAGTMTISLEQEMAMIDRGYASIGDVDISMQLGAGHPMGPLHLADDVGLDITYKVLKG